MGGGGGGGGKEISALPPLYETMLFVFGFDITASL